MIYYETHEFINILFARNGSPLAGNGPRRAFTFAVLSLLLVIAHKYIGWAGYEDSTAIRDTLTVANTFMGLLISFRLNSAFLQWRAGVNAIGAFAEAARHLFSTACAQLNVVHYDRMPKSTGEEVEHLEFSSKHEETSSKCKLLTDLRRLLLLYVALAFHQCRDVEGMESLKSTHLLTKDELEELDESGVKTTRGPSHNNKIKTHRMHSPNKLRSAVVELWIRRLIQESKRAGFLAVNEATAMNASLTTMTNLNHTVYTVAHCPIPFNYAQFLSIMIVMYLYLYACVIVPSSGWFSAGWVFAWGMVLFTADDVANEIECPFGTDANDIDLEYRLLKIEDELTVLLKSTYHFGGIVMPKKEILFRDPPQTAPIPSQKYFSARNVDSRAALAMSTPERLPSLQDAMSAGSDSNAVPHIDEYTPLIVNNMGADIKGYQTTAGAGQAESPPNQV